MPNELSPFKIAEAGSEHAHQVALFLWASQQRHIPELQLMFAIPNGSQRHKAVAAKLKAEGVKAGVLDICLPVARGQWHGLFIELKKLKKDGGQGPTPDQMSWMHRLQQQGYGATVCVGWEVARDVITQYLNWR